jgi:hypothetical protein
VKLRVALAVLFIAAVSPTNGAARGVAALIGVGSNGPLAEAGSGAALVVAFSCKANAFKLVVPRVAPLRARVVEYHTRQTTAFPTGRIVADVNWQAAGIAPFCQAVKIRRPRPTELVGPYPLSPFKPMNVYCQKSQFWKKTPGTRVSPRVYAKQIVLWRRPILNRARQRIGTRLVVLTDSTPKVDLSFTRRAGRVSFDLRCLRDPPF